MRTTLLLTTLVLLLSLPAGANDSAMNDGAYGPEPLGWRPGAESVIRMVDEKLQIDFHPDHSLVRVKFTFRNTGTTPARQLLGFPDQSAANEISMALERDGINVMGQMEEVVTLLDDEETWSDRRTGYVRWDDSGSWQPVTGVTDDSMPMVWWTFWVDFPVNKDVTVERRYRVRNGAQAGGPTWFEYTTATGAAWRGTIGALTADVYLHDGLTADDIVWWNDGGRLTPAPPAGSGWSRVTPTHLRLQWRDFEPGSQEDRRGFRVMTDVDYGAKPGESLRYAARFGQNYMLRLRMEEAADLNDRDAQGRTALYGAVANRQYVAVRILLEAGAAAGLADAQGKTPLMVAAQTGQGDLVEQLLAYGAAPGVRDAQGRTARDFAVYNGHADIADLLRRTTGAAGRSGR